MQWDSWLPSQRAWPTPASVRTPCRPSTTTISSCRLIGLMRPWLFCKRCLERSPASIRDRDRLDLDQPFRRGERGDADEGRSRRLHAFEEGRAGLADDRAQLRLVADHEGRDLHDIGVGRAGSLQRMAEILHHLRGLRSEIALTDDPPFFVGRYLAGDVDGACARGGHDVGISGIVMQAAGAEMVELGHGWLPEFVVGSERSWRGS